MLPKGYAAKQSIASTLVPILERQAPTGRITINDLYIGDQGATILASTLKQFPNIGIIDLKGNNIGPSGFIEIFQALKSNLALRNLSLQWNNICANNNLQALELLFQVMSINKSITHIDLQNNRLNSAVGGILANIIRNNPQLRSIDLRWNEMGNQGIRLLIAAVAANGFILAVEVQGNGAAEDTLKELNSVVMQNRENHQQCNVPGQKQGQQVQSQNRQPIKEMAAHLEEERRTVARHLEKLIERERELGLQLKEEYEVKLGQQNSKQASNLAKIESLEKYISEISNVKNIQRTEITKWDDQIKDLQGRRTQSYRMIDEKLQIVEKRVRDQEKEYQGQLSELQRDHFTQLRELDSEWGVKCDQIMEYNRSMDDHNQDLLHKIHMATDQIHQFNNDQSTQTMEIIEQIKMLVLNSFKEKLKVMEIEVEQIDQDRLSLNRKHQETLLEAQRDYKKGCEEHQDMLRDKIRLSIETKGQTIENNQLDHRIQMITKDLQYRDNLEAKLEQELEKLKEKDFKINDEDNKQINQVNVIFKNDQGAHIKLKEELKEREQQLDSTLRTSDQENHRLASDISRLIETLQANSTKAIFSTFHEHNFI